MKQVVYFCEKEEILLFFLDKRLTNNTKMIIVLGE